MRNYASDELSGGPACRNFYERAFDEISTPAAGAVVWWNEA